MKVVLVLTGAHAGKNIVLSGRQFIQGRHTVSGNSNELETLTRFYARAHAAFVDGTPELKAAQARDDARNKANGVLSGVQAGVEDAGAERVSGERVAEAGSVPEASATGSAGDELRTPGGEARVVPGGRGHEDAGLHPDEVNKIRLMLRKLDPAKDEHWSAEGLPSVETVAAALSRPDLSRAMLDIAAPGFDRAKATEIAAELKAKVQELTTPKAPAGGLDDI